MLAHVCRTSVSTPVCPSRTFRFSFLTREDAFDMRARPLSRGDGSCVRPAAATVTACAALAVSRGVCTWWIPRWLRIALPAVPTAIALTDRSASPDCAAYYFIFIEQNGAPLNPNTDQERRLLSALYDTVSVRNSSFLHVSCCRWSTGSIWSLACRCGRPWILTPVRRPSKGSSSARRCSWPLRSFSCNATMRRR